MKVSSRHTGVRMFELGFFIGKLNPNQVCLLYKEGVELPSGIRDVAYVPMDSADNWKLKIRKEMMNAGLPVESSKSPIEEPLHYHEEVAI